MKKEANARQTGAKNAKKPPIKTEVPANSGRVRFALVPIVRQFRSHTQKNQARLWIPFETSLLVRYEFASCSLQTRYIFVAIVLFCGANGIEEIPLDARFMSSVLIADERTIQKSFDELLEKNMLVERKEREIKKEQTEQTEPGGVSVDSQNLFQEKAKDEIAGDLPKTNSSPELKNESAKHSQFSLDECLNYVEICKSGGDQIQNAKALARNLYKTGEADSFILATLYPEKQEEIDRRQFGEPVKFLDSPCLVCYGAKMADAGGKGFRHCEHCKNERGKSTGFEPQRDLPV